jgi:multidrug efflux pump
VRVELMPFCAEPLRHLHGGRARRHPVHHANRPKGDVDVRGPRLQIYTGTGMANNGKSASDYRDLVVAWRNGAAVRLADVADVSDGVENINTMGLFNGEPAVIVLVTLQPSANVIETVDGVRALLPELRGSCRRTSKCRWPPTAPTRSAPRCTRSS